MGHDLNRNIRGQRTEYIDVNTTLTRDLFIELLDFIEEPDDDTTAAEGSDA